MSDCKIHVNLPIIVEGKYDKIKLESVVDGLIITTDGFGIFKKKEKLKLVLRIKFYIIIEHQCKVLNK